MGRATDSSKSRLALYGVPMPLLARWCLSYLAQIEGPLQGWVDLGSGSGHLLKAIEITPSNGIAVDVCRELIRAPGFSSYHGTIDEFLKSDLSKTANHIVTLFDVIEHFEKAEAMGLLRLLDNRFSAKILFTPDGFLKQDGDTHRSFCEKPYMWHRCGFCAEELERIGYLVVILKRYHGKPPGHKKQFNALFAFKKDSFSSPDYERMIINMREQHLRWLLNPSNLFRSLRVRLGIPFRSSMPAEGKIGNGPSKTFGL